MGADGTPYQARQPWRSVDPAASRAGGGGYTQIMKRRLIAFLIVMAIGLQSPIIAYAAAAAGTTGAGSALMPCDSAAHAATHPGISPKSCCPGGEPTANCCLSICLVAVGVTARPAPTRAYAPTAPPFRPTASSFTSRGDAPLIRPPIL
jgi:hypothetical protein